MTLEFFQPDYLRRWVLGEGPDLNTVDEQDTPWIIADHVSADELIEAYEIPGGITERRDELLFCIGLQLERHLGSSHPDSEEENVADLERIVDFVLGHSHDFLERHQELGFGADYDRIVIPFIKRRLESPPAGT